MSAGCSSAELQANSRGARIRTWTHRVNSSARYRLTPRGKGGERGALRKPRGSARAPTYLGSNQAPSPTWVPLRGGGRASRTLMPVRHQLPFSRRWPLPMGDPSICVLCRVGPDGIEPPTSSMWARRSAAELWTNDRGTGDAVPRRRCALDHQALRTGGPPRKRWHARKDSNLRRTRCWKPALYR